MWQKSYADGPILYLVPTPIGNMEDITYRAIKILNDVSVIFSEDTRQTAILLNYYGIKSKLICLEDHNENVIKEKVLNCLNEGENVAIVTDRGTPIISDPGYKTVNYVIDNGYNVVSLPGATAFVPALTVSGLAPLPFVFYGFLNSRASKRKRELENLKNIEYSMIFYESPHRIIDVLSEMLDIFGDRNISISREISKKFESVYRGTLSDVINNFDTVKGEFVIVVEGYNNKLDNNDIDYEEIVNNKIKEGYSISDAIKIVAKEYNISKNILYKKYHGGK